MNQINIENTCMYVDEYTIWYVPGNKSNSLKKREKYEKALID